MSKLPIYSLNAGVQQPANNRDTEILNGFFEVINLFEKIGIQKNIIETIETEVQQQYYRNNSFNFPFKLLAGDVLMVGNKNIPLNTQGLNSGIDLSMFNTGNGGLATTTPVGVQTTSSGSGILNSLTSLVDPTGGLLTGLLGDLNITENIGNVLQYGLSSWGASTTPEKSSQDFNQNAVPIVQNFLQGLNNQNFASKINAVEKYLSYLIALETHGLQYHSKAKSTRLGRQKIIDLAKKLRNETVESVNNKLRTKGVIINVTTKQQNASQDNYAWNRDPGFIDKEVYSYKVYSYTVPKNVNVTQPQYNANGSIVLASNGNPQSNPNGNVIPQPPTNNNMSKIIGYGSAIALAGFVVVPMLNKKTKPSK